MTDIEPSRTSVSVRDLTVSYGRLTILDRLNIDVGRGEFLVLLGSSGCGKSTLLNAIAGLMDITDGEVWISGKNVTWAEPKDRGIGMVFQSYALYPRMTVAQNIGFGLRVAGMPRAEVKQRVAETARTLQIEHLLDRRPADLSGGQRQRVAIGRALVRKVDVFLFDEPLSNLDAQLRSELRVEIKQLHQTLGNTMIYVTHDQVEAMVLADRVAVMKSGTIQQLASPSEIYQRPANRFVAGFLGSPAMNFFEGQVVLAADMPMLDLGEIRLPLPVEAMAQPPTAGQPITLGLRPEQMRIVSDPTIARHAVPAEVLVLEPIGSETIVWARCAGRRISVRAEADAGFAAGTPLMLDFDLARASFFDTKSGDRL
ncbi:ABC transporter ATP-binding protein [Acidisoma cladoniae]|uniref:ABC transporter ATP-binding protein n=1 Tax=Acidisoma cladoniae TaxID=3040935 RepID=UPI00254C3B46|nr:ABC transporter ATP-binding protein [Acidisoma sp. PAMC 29798]